MKNLCRLAALMALVAALAVPTRAATLDTLIGGGTVSQGDLVFSNFVVSFLGGALVPANIDVAPLTTAAGASGLRFSGVPSGSLSQSTAGGGAHEIVVDIVFTVSAAPGFSISGAQQAVDPAALANQNAVIYSFTSIPANTGTTASLSDCMVGTTFPGLCTVHVNSAVVNGGATSLIVDRQVQMIVGQAVKGVSGGGSTAIAYFDIAFPTAATCSPLSGVSIAATGSTTFCAGGGGGTATVTDNGGGLSLHQWGFRTTVGGAITAIAGQTGNSYALSAADFPGTGTFLLLCTTTPSCGSLGLSNDIPVTINAPPAAPVIATAPSVSFSSTAVVASVVSTPGSSWIWSIANGAILAGQGTSQITWSPAAAGTTALSVTETNAGGCSASSSVSVAVVAAAPPRVPGDFAGNGSSDLLWRNSVTGENVVWLMSGLNFSSTAALPRVVEPEWQIAGTGDFNGDGHPDIVWRNSITGQNVVWYLNGVTFAAFDFLPTVVEPEWHIVATGDFNGDGHPDLLWRNGITGQNLVWYMNGVTFLSYDFLPTVVEPEWQIAGTGDFDGDGHPDIVWRNSLTGQNVLWYMSGPVFLSFGSLPTVSEPEWQIVGIGDFNGDGHPDLVWRNSLTGENVAWLLAGATFSSFSPLPTVPEQQWRIVGPK